MADDERRAEIEAVEAPLSPFMLRAADRLYAECERAVREGRIGARSPIGDATLDYREMREECGPPVRDARGDDPGTGNRMSRVQRGHREGVMADDEQRVEIEAVANAIHDAHSNVLNNRSARGIAQTAIWAFDRVRDARGDDEEGRCDVCADAPYPWNCERCNPSSARSPQDEDHEAGIAREGLQRILDMGCPLGREGDLLGEAQKIASETITQLNVLSRVSPSRDGSVAVEDQVGWLTVHQRAYRQMQDRALSAEAELERLRRVGSVTVEDVVAFVRRIAGVEHTARSVADAIEREFSPASTGDHEHEWVDARNSIVTSGEVCVGCGAVRASTGDQAPKEENDRGRH